MPEYGLAEQPKQPDDFWPDDLRLDLGALAEQERESRQREIDVQNAVIQTPASLQELRSELAQIADAALRQAKIAEQEAASAKKDARFSKTISILSLLVSIGSLTVAAIALAIR